MRRELVHTHLMALVLPEVVRGPASATTALHRPLFDEGTRGSLFDLCFDNLLIYKYFSFLVSYILSRNSKLWLDMGSVLVFTGL